MRRLHLLGILPALLAAAPASAEEEDDQDSPEASADHPGGVRAEGAGGPRSTTDDAPIIVYGEGIGEYRLRASFLSELPLSPVIPGDASDTDELGQEFWVDQWFRVRLDFGVRDRLRFVGETDAFDGVVVGQFTRGVEAADRAREAATAFPGIRPRALFFEWTPEQLSLTAGLTPVHWGLGIFDNDGAREPPFGDYRYGDLMTRIAVTLQPFGPDSPLYVGGGGDLVFEDQMADIRDGDLAWRGVLAAVYREEERRLGLYTAYRHQRSDVDRNGTEVSDVLDGVTVDVFARWDGTDPSGGKVFGALEAFYTHSEVRVGGGRLTPIEPGRDEVGAAAQIGRLSSHVDASFELGYASEGGLDRAVIHPDHRVGLILFPEVIAWQSARAATLIESELLEGRVPAATPLVPTEGGVANAVYLQPVVTWRMSKHLRARFGAVWARAVTDVVDPYRLAVEGRRANYRGGDPRNHDYGLELDAQLHAEGELARGIVLSGGLEAAWFLPGHAFDDAAGETMDPLGLFRVRTGLTF
jgi:hypothetical protein